MNGALPPNGYISSLSPLPPPNKSKFYILPPSEIQMPNSLHSSILLLFFLFLLCDSHSHPADLSSLLSFKTSLDGGSLSSWDPSSDPCGWPGVSCRRGWVARVALERLGLHGSLEPLTRLRRLALLSLANNSFSGPLRSLDLSPWAPHLTHLYLSRNRFSGPFPESILRLRHLRRLDLSYNALSGPIPDDIGARLPSLLTFRVDRNAFAGRIPASLGEIRGLAELNLSYNRLSGEIPHSLVSFPNDSFVGNIGLWGPANRTSRRWQWFAVAISASLIATATMTFLIVKRRRKKGAVEVEAKKDEEELVFFGGCKEFVMEDLMRGSAEMLGRGVVGTTYRVVVEGGGGGGEGVVVKRVRKGRLRWDDGVEVEGVLREIGGWRHPNVVSLLAYYSSQDELLLVFDYIPRGSLHYLLHGDRGPGRTPLDWRERLEIARGVAKGLAYLHAASKSKLSHHHFTSSNILVNDDGIALISDFALHQLLVPSSPPTASDTDAICGNDVYGFGIVLLEILTGQADGEGGEDLPSRVRKVVDEEWSSELFDLELLRSRESEDEMFSLLQVALLCVACEPSRRPAMAVVCKMIDDIKERGSRRGKGSPSMYESSPALSEDATTFTSS